MSSFSFSLLCSSVCSFCSVLCTSVPFGLLWQALKQIRELASLCKAPCVCDQKRGDCWLWAVCWLCFLCPPPKPVHRRKPFCVCCHRSISYQEYYFSMQTVLKVWCIVWVHMRVATSCCVDPSTLPVSFITFSSSFLCLHNLILCAHDFFSTLSFSSALLLSFTVCVCVCCEIVSTVRIALLLCLSLVFRKIVEVLSAAQQRLDGVTAKLWPLGAWLRSSSQ